MCKKVIVIGGGFAGLSCAYRLKKFGFEVQILEREANLGGLARGIKFKDWKWPLEKAVHHLFANDYEIIQLVKDSGFSDNLFFKRPLTGYVYKIKGKIKFFVLDSPVSLLLFPLLDMFSKLRAGLSLLFLRLSPFFSWYQQISSIGFIKATMGEKVYITLWRPLFRKKFGKYAGNVLASFFWARIVKRTASLGYFKAGFQSFIDYLADKLKEAGVSIKTQAEVLSISKNSKAFQIKYRFNNKVHHINADYVVCALQAPIFLRLTENLLPESYKAKLSSIKYLNAVSLIIQTDKPIVKDFYWLNNAVDEFDFTVFIQHTNFISKKNYAGKHIAYVGWYCDFSDKIWQFKTAEEVLSYIRPYLIEINPDFDRFQVKVDLFKAVYAQPIFDKDFIAANLSCKTPVANLFFAGFELSYPYDRGTNYAVKVGLQTADEIINSSF
ncbi:MAG: oxidoreductase [Patescibacteria group bacterium]|nr:MAG: oxidoreductase [Patescibacteria group bacterium]